MQALPGDVARRRRPVYRRFAELRASPLRRPPTRRAPAGRDRPTIPPVAAARHHRRVPAHRLRDGMVESQGRRPTRCNHAANRPAHGSPRVMAAASACRPLSSTAPLSPCNQAASACIGGQHIPRIRGKLRHRFAQLLARARHIRLAAAKVQSAQKARRFALQLA